MKFNVSDVSNAEYHRQDYKKFYNWITKDACISMENKYKPTYIDDLGYDTGNVLYYEVT